MNEFGLIESILNKKLFLSQLEVSSNDDDLSSTVDRICQLIQLVAPSNISQIRERKQKKKKKREKQ